MQDLALKNQDAAMLVRDFNSQLGTDMRARVRLYDGEYVDAERFSYTRSELLRVIPQLSSGTVHTTSELLWSGCWDSFGKKGKQVVRRCVMHLALTREVNLKLFTLKPKGEPMFQVV